MKTYATMVYDLGPQDRPLVFVLGDGRVALSYQAWSGMPAGFTIAFAHDHLPLVRELCQTLEVQSGITAPKTTDDATDDVAQS